MFGELQSTVLGAASKDYSNTVKSTHRSCLDADKQKPIQQNSSSPLITVLLTYMFLNTVVRAGFTYKVFHALVLATFGIMCSRKNLPILHAKL